MEVVLCTGVVAYRLVAQRPLDEEQIEEGDHIWCHVSGRYLKSIQHHGICATVDGVRGVIHFDGEHNDSYYVYHNCTDCQARLSTRRTLGNPEQNVRFSCFNCFSRGQRIYRCEYGRSLKSVAFRETGSRSTQTSHPGDVVADAARAFYRDNNFGEYHLLTRNCEDFTRFCKIGKVGSKQVARGLIIAGAIAGIIIT